MEGAGSGSSASGQTYQPVDSSYRAAQHSLAERPKSGAPESQSLRTISTPDGPSTSTSSTASSMVPSTRSTAGRSSDAASRRRRPHSAAQALSSNIHCSQTGLLYDLSTIKGQARAWAVKALDSNGLSLLSCNEDTKLHFFKFEIRDTDPIVVYVGDPQRKNYRIPECKCGAKNNVNTCKVGSSCRTCTLEC